MTGRPAKLELLNHLHPNIEADVARFRAAGEGWRQIAAWIAQVTGGVVAPSHETVRSWFGGKK